MSAPKKLAEEEIGLLEESRRVMLWNVDTFPATAASERKTWLQRAMVIESAAARLRYVEARLEELTRAIEREHAHVREKDAEIERLKEELAVEKLDLAVTTQDKEQLILEVQRLNAATVPIPTGNFHYTPADLRQWADWNTNCAVMLRRGRISEGRSHDQTAAIYRRAADTIEELAALTSRTCETCRHEGVPFQSPGVDVAHRWCQHPVVSATVPVSVGDQLFGCSAHEPKDGAERLLHPALGPDGEGIIYSTGVRFAYGSAHEPKETK